MRTIAHVTHEAIQKVGGIGAVLDGLLTSEPYRESGARTILIGPWFPGEDPVEQRLGPAGDVLYSSLDGQTRHPVAEALNQVRREFHVEIVYGHRALVNPHNGVRVTPEVVLIDVSRMCLDKINMFKAGLWDAYGINSCEYELSWEYDLYVKLAQPALATLRALGAAGRKGQCVIVAHEFMGLPTALATRFDPLDAFRTVFYAHEVAAVRRIVEHHPGHDVTFYNLLEEALAKGRYLDDVFGPQHYYRHALVQASCHCDRILAVGDHAERELRFLGPDFADAPIEITYNGIPAERISLDERKASRERMKDYAETLLGDRPDYIFTHVTRNITSKGLWRDFRVLEHLERAFREQGKSAVLFVLSTEMPARSSEDIRWMEEASDWPVAHREGGPDLSYGEAIFHTGVQGFNARARQIKVVFVNQFGWERAVCGDRMPADMTFLDIRRGTDVEFGQSIYEPFGISHLEPLTYGAICVVSDVCGCAGFVQKIAGESIPNVLIANYTRCGPSRHSELEWLTITRHERHHWEQEVAARVARDLLARLPADDETMERLMDAGFELASRMSWDVVARDLVLPAIDAICADWPKVQVA